MSITRPWSRIVLAVPYGLPIGELAVSCRDPLDLFIPTKMQNFSTHGGVIVLINLHVWRMLTRLSSAAYFDPLAFRAVCHRVPLGQRPSQHGGEFDPTAAFGSVGRPFHMSTK